MFSKDEALLNKDIASAHVHIERINQRIPFLIKKTYSKFAWSIICVMCNLSSSITFLIHILHVIICQSK